MRYINLHLLKGKR